MARSFLASAQNRGDNLAHLSAPKRSPTHNKTLAPAVGAPQALPTLHRSRDNSPHSDVCSSYPEPSDHSRTPSSTIIDHRRTRSSQSHGILGNKNNNSRSPVVVRAMTVPLDIPRSTVSSPGLPSPESLGKFAHTSRPRSTSPMSTSSSSSSSSRLSRPIPSFSPSPPSSTAPNKRRRARTITISSSSKSGAPSSLSGIGRKVADSLQLFRETSGPSGTVPTTIGGPSSADCALSEYVVNSAEVVCPGGVRPNGNLSAIKGNGIVRDVSGHDTSRDSDDDDQDEEIGTVFVKRQEWPERESRAARHRASTTTTTSVRASPSGAAALDPLFLQRDSGNSSRNSESAPSWQGDDAVWNYDGDRGRHMDRELRSLSKHQGPRKEREEDEQSKAAGLLFRCLVVIVKLSRSFFYCSRLFEVGRFK